MLFEEIVDVDRRKSGGYLVTKGVSNQGTAYVLRIKSNLAGQVSEILFRVGFPQFAAGAYSQILRVPLVVASVLIHDLYSH